MHYQPIKAPDELEALAPEELFKRVKPLLRQGGLSRDDESLARIKPNIPSACFELATEWRRSRTLDGRNVPFGDYFAARLCTKLKELDREAEPQPLRPPRQISTRGRHPPPQPRAARQ